MTLPTKTLQWLLANKPTDLPVLSGSNPTFKLETKPLPTLEADQVLVRTLYMSNDPAQRGWISAHVNPDRLYVPPVPLNTPMRARSIASVLSSTSTSFKEGDKVAANTGWSKYAVCDAKDVQPIQSIPGLSDTHFLGALGFTGLTAYYGLIDIAQCAPEDIVIISGAAGATGSMVVQIAKHIVGCKRVIGIAGGSAKCSWVESLGADVCVDYKDSPKKFKDALITATPEYASVYFDNVGGEVLDLCLTRMKRHGRIAACGAVSNYNTSSPTALKNYSEVISMRLEIRGFIIFDFLAMEGGKKVKEALGVLREAISNGKVKVGDENETVVESSWEKVPNVWMRLFEGGNQGKLITKVA
jgi:NADPH-dependent curcumin reductase CurA